jgi:2-desacetyl-2-hydroxyethyl bacteriochlorophyllide A dehydrogenase
MKAVVFEKPHQVTVSDKPLRRLSPEEVLVRVSACGVCGTDVHIVEGESRSTPPVVIGHEYAGFIDDVGANVRSFAPGDRVAVDPNISCGTCYFCRRGEVHLCSQLRALGVDIDGGMAELSIVPERQLHRLPEGFPMVAWPFIEPVSCVVHGIDRARIRTGDTVVIFGGGTIGLMMLQLAVSAGASTAIVVEPFEFKQAIARRLGATMVLDPAKRNIIDDIMDVTQVGADVVIDCAGRVETVQAAVEVARRGGLVECFGVCPIGRSFPLQPNQVYFKELTIVGSFVNPHTFDRAIRALSSGTVKVDQLPVHRFPLEGIHEALLYQKEGRTMKSIMEPNGPARS